MQDCPFIKNEQGLYKVQGQVTPRAIVDAAAKILLEELIQREALGSPTEVVQFLQLSLSGEKNEHFSVLYLNTKHQILAFEKLFQGTIDGAAVYPRVVAQKALEHNAAAVIFAHNHPSGNCEPSQADRVITQRLRDALALLDIRVLDHIIISRTDWTSLAEQGLL